MYNIFDFCVATFLIFEKKIIFSSLINFSEKQQNTFGDALDLKAMPIIVGEPIGVTKKIYKQIEEKKLHSDKYLLIINESFGKPKNNEILKDIIKPILVDQEKYSEFQISYNIYNGATIHGEFRELCSASIENFNIKELALGYEKCLPNMLKEFGFNSISYHGALGVMYDRKYWYPKAGFNQSYFHESLNWKSRCYSFPGVCDVEFIPYIKHNFRHKKTFVYWLTLNTHSPYDARDLEVDRFDCQKHHIEIDSQVCKNFKLQAQFFYNLSILFNDNSMRGVDVYIAGDHTPPIFNGNLKKMYFDGDNIISIHLKIK